MNDQNIYSLLQKEKKAVTRYKAEIIYNLLLQYLRALGGAMWKPSAVKAL